MNWTVDWETCYTPNIQLQLYKHAKVSIKQNYKKEQLTLARKQKHWL